MTQAWLLVERYEDHGTDVGNVISLWATQASAEKARAAEEDEHDWYTECRYCGRLLVREGGSTGVFVDDDAGLPTCPEADSPDRLLTAHSPEIDKSEWCLCCGHDWTVQGPEEVLA